MSENKQKTPFEKTAEKFNIDLKNQKYEPKKPLDPTWIPDIIKQNIESIECKNSQTVINKNSGIFEIGFDNIEEKEKFEKEFSKKLFSTINQFIREKGENPQNYQRGITLETESEGLSVKFYT